MAVHERESTLGGVTFDRGSVGNHLTLEVGNDLTLKLGNDLTLKVGNDLAPELGNHLALEASKLGNYDGPRQSVPNRHSRSCRTQSNSLDALPFSGRQRRKSR